jgi:hypothetical protein
MMAWLMVEAKRYDDARLAFEKLFNHYHPLRESLLHQHIKEIWPGFALNFDTKKTTHQNIIPGVPSSFTGDLLLVKAIISLRDRIEKSHAQVSEIEEMMHAQGKNQEDDWLIKIKNLQEALEYGYYEMVVKQQEEIARKIAIAINHTMAEAEYLRAGLVQLEMSDLEKQVSAVQKFQTEKLDAFFEKLKKIDEGNAP